VLPELRNSLLSTSQEREVSELHESFKCFHEATLKLQLDSTTLLDAHMIFSVLYDLLVVSWTDKVDDDVLQYCKDKLDTRYAQCADFEKGVVSVLDGNRNALSAVEKIAINGLKKIGDDGGSGRSGNSIEAIQAVPGEVKSLDERMQAKRRRINEDEIEYLNLEFIFPTSNLCERFFSTAGRCFTELRRSLSDSNLEAQLFLNFNREFWDIATLASLPE
jgi:hypothetical protein